MTSSTYDLFSIPLIIPYICGLLHGDAPLLLLPQQPSQIRRVRRHVQRLAIVPQVGGEPRRQELRRGGSEVPRGGGRSARRGLAQRGEVLRPAVHRGPHAPYGMPIWLEEAWLSGLKQARCTTFHISQYTYICHNLYISIYSYIYILAIPLHERVDTAPEPLWELRRG